MPVRIKCADVIRAVAEAAAGTIATACPEMPMARAADLGIEIARLVSLRLAGQHAYFPAPARLARYFRDRSILESYTEPGGPTQDELAEQHGLSQARISQILSPSRRI